MAKSAAKKAVEFISTRLNEAEADGYQQQEKRQNGIPDEHGIDSNGQLWIRYNDTIIFFAPVTVRRVTQESQS